MKALHIIDLKKTFGGIKALDSVSLTLGTGEFVGLIGPNGSGKSTLINCVTGHYGVDAGFITLEDRRLENRSPEFIVKMGLGRTFQVTKIFRRLTVRENLRVPLTAQYGRKWRRQTSRLDNILETIRLTRLADHPAGRLSGGQQRLLEFGMMLVSLPEVVLLDEPFAGIHPKLRAQLQEILAEIRRQGKTILLVSHDMGSVFRLCERVIVLDKGRKIADGPPDDVRQMPAIHNAYLGG